MLKKLIVKNYALIKDLDIDFENGLSIITGETGAGKSILLGALSLILGNRTDSSVLLEKSDKCVVEGTFDIEGYGLEPFFTSNELDFDNTTIIRREINPAGKSRAFINDVPANLGTLKELGDKLIDIHSQHQTLMLNENSFQLGLIDSFADTVKLREEYSVFYTTYRNNLKEYSSLKENYDKNRADHEYYSFQLKQLIDSNLAENEQEELEKEQEILTHTEEIKLALNTSSELLSSENNSVLSMVKELKSNISKISGFLKDGKELLDRCESIFIELNDIASEIDKKDASIESNPQRLQFVTDRLDMLFSLMQKHRVKSVEELIAKRDEIKEIINNLSTNDDRLVELETLLTSGKKELSRLSELISAKRKSVVNKIETTVSQQLHDLGMANARFVIQLKQLTDFTPSGKDEADFLFSANKRIEVENLAKTASGGELSRVMLSLKSFLSKNNGLPTIIFDEIDSGVSGEVADKVGSILSEMGKYMQVINITHLPQVAARGSQHFHVYKDDSGEKTVTRIRLLSGEERILEIAGLLSGKEITAAAINNAKELIGN